MSRSARQFSDGIHWIYVCSCDPSLSELAKSLSSQIAYEYAQYVNTFPYCIHINAVSEIISKVDAIHCLSPHVDFTGILMF